MYRRAGGPLPTATPRRRRGVIGSRGDSPTPEWGEARASPGHPRAPEGGALLALGKQKAVHEGRFQRPGRTPDEDDMAARDAAAEASVQAHHVGGNLVRGLRQRWNPSRPRQETARCERLVDDKMLSRQSPEDARTAKNRSPDLHTDPCTSSFGRWSWGTVSD